MEPGTESYVVDYGFLARARAQAHDHLHRDPEASFIDKTALGPNRPDTLKYLLKDAMITAVKDDKQTFLPLGKLDALCNRDTVRDELLLTFPPNSIETIRYVNYVCGDPSDNCREEHVSRKIFAILVLIGRLEKITTFIEQGIKDKHLPFRKLMTGKDPNEFDLMRRSTLDQSNPQTMDFFSSWNSVDKREFYQTQWQLLSPFFGKAPMDSAALYKLDEQTIMPWVSMADGVYVPLESHGGYSTVRKIVIHQDHHSFETEIFAIKELLDGDKGPFENEFNNLKKVQTRKHLLPVHAAYFCGNQYSFICPWAHGGSLDDLWEREPQSLMPEPERDFPMLVEWVAGQFSGLTGEFGLGFLHGSNELSEDLLVPDEKPFGIHGDIKPSNILYFKQDPNHDYLNPPKDILKISDFGLTGFHSARTRSRQPNTGPHSPTYRSPEWGRDGESEGFLSRKYDIWSLGCLFLQFLTWLIGGPKAVKRFNEDRHNDVRDTGTRFRDDKFFAINEKGRYIKKTVTKWVDALQKHVGEGNYLHDCLGFITNHMLEISDKNRADCSKVHEFLERHYKKCCREEQYSKINISTPFEPTSQLETEAYEPLRASSTTIESSTVGQRLSYPSITVTEPDGAETITDRDGRATITNHYDEEIVTDPDGAETVTDRNYGSVSQISHHEDHVNRSPTILPDNPNHQGNPHPQEEYPQDQQPPLGRLRAPPSGFFIDEAPNPETTGSVLNVKSPPQQPSPEKKSLKQASFPRRVRKWLCFV